MSKKKKEIKHINIFRINAEKQMMCGPPIFWEMEAAIDVFFDDGTSEVQYISIVDMEDAYWQVTSKPVNEISDEENFQSYIIASWEDKEDALKSSYGKIMKELDAIFEKISVV